ncbi:MAG: Hsp20 family protein [Oxalobacteraceae bacterium]|nr:MAG: Hsp20 family protein [Oxalobacteraceae bacterium]
MNRTFTAEQLLRHFIGYDSVAANASAFPPHNIERIDDNHFQLTLAVAGFSREDIEMYLHQGVLTISGRKRPLLSESFKGREALSEEELVENERLWKEENESTAVNVDPRGNAAKPAPVFIHQGIAFRDWDRQFNLGQHIVIADARMDNGLLVVDLERRVPEELRPKPINIR